ncbi:fibronectin type III domain-containing protein [Pseudomonas sp. NFX224]|uniref:fibronectin type III domain-containing protein n=1 Tax=Pseudomonas sp. NFX224 TaxID=3402862 RepID=UPI003AFB20BA
MNDDTNGAAASSPASTSDDIEPKANYSRWMTDISAEISHLKLYQLAIPGTHNSGVDMAGTWGFEELLAANQDNSFPQQLAAGSRYLDLRLVDSSYKKTVGNKFPTYVFNEIFEFKHGIVSAGRRLNHLIENVKNFITANPGEIVILDFHSYDRGQYSHNSLQRCLPYFSPIKNLLIPLSASDLSLQEIRTKHPGCSIVLALNHGYPKPEPGTTDKWQSNWVQREQIWGGFKRNWNPDPSESAVEDNVIKSMESPPTDAYWVLDASSRNGNGAMYLRKDHPIRKETFKEGYQNAQIVIVDFIERPDSLISVVDRCIALNILRAVDKTNPAPPTDLKVKAELGQDLQNTLRFTWKTATDNLGVRSYEVYRNDEHYFHTTKITYEVKNDRLLNHTFKVRAADHSNNQSEFSTPFELIQDKTPPTIPENFRFELAGFTVVYCRWDPSFDEAGIEGYEIDCDGDPLFTDSTVCSFIANPHKQHEIKLRAKDINGFYSEYTNLTLLPRPSLSNPKIVVTSHVNGSRYRAQIVWDPIKNIPKNHSVVVEYSMHSKWHMHYCNEDEAPTFEFEADAGEKIEIHAHINLHFNLREYDRSELFMHEAIFDPIPPEPITNLKITHRDPAGTSISWTPSSSTVVTAYEISLNEESPILVPKSATSYTFKEMPLIENFLVDVWAINDCYACSTIESITIDSIDITPPEKPGTPIITHISVNTAQLSWTPSNDNVAVTGYTITTNNKPPISTTSTQYTLTELEEAHQYTVEIKAFDAAGNSSPPSTASFRTKARPTPPRQLSYSNLTSASVKLSWLAGSDDGSVTGYTITTNNKPPISTTSTQYTLTELEEAYQYTVEIKAFDADGNSSPPSTVSFRTKARPTPPRQLSYSNLTSASVLFAK